MTARASFSRELLLQLVRDGHTNAQIAAEFGCAVRTIDRHRAADPDLSREIIRIRAELAALEAPDHGTYQRYRHGCRCRPCTSANTIRCRAVQMARRARQGLPPPNPRLGRRRTVPETVSPTGHTEDRDTLIEQAIARGDSTLAIMHQLGCDYEAVAAVRGNLAEAIAS